MKLGTRGLALVKHYESLRLQSYQDTGGVWTVGYGHTGPKVKPGDRITEAQADSLLKQDAAVAEDAVSKMVRVGLRQSQFDALVSLVFNIGAAQFATSSLLKRVNALDHLSVPSEFCKWRFDNGQPLLGLIRRRVAEAALYLEDI